MSVRTARLTAGYGICGPNAIAWTGPRVAPSRPVAAALPVFLAQTHVSARAVGGLAAPQLR